MNVLKDFDLEIIYALRSVLNTRTMSKDAPATETVASFYSLNSLTHCPVERGESCKLAPTRFTAKVASSVHVPLAAAPW